MDNHAVNKTKEKPERPNLSVYVEALITPHCSHKTPLTEPKAGKCSETLELLC